MIMTFEQAENRLPETRRLPNTPKLSLNERDLSHKDPQSLNLLGPDKVINSIQLTQFT